MVSWRYFFVVCGLSTSFFGVAVPTTLSCEDLKIVNGYLGTEEACCKVKDLVRGIQKELGMEGFSLEVRSLSEMGLREESPGLAFKRQYLFFDEATLLQMPLDEQRWLIGHELIHIRNNHNKKKNICEKSILYTGVALSIVAAWLVWKNLTTRYSYADEVLYGDVQWEGLFADPDKWEAFKVSLGTASAGSLASLCCAGVTLMSLSRSYEEEADCYAAHELHCALGGCRFFLKEIFKNKDLSLESGVNNTHPTNFKRFVNLVMISGDAKLHDLVFEKEDKDVDVYLKDIQDYLESKK